MSVSESDSKYQQPVTHFYLDPGAVTGNHCCFSTTESHHIVKVCRLQPGDLIDAADGAGTLYRVEINEVSGRTVTGKVVDANKNVNELNIGITVAFGLLTMNKTEDVIDQLTQLGVTNIQPLVCDKGVSRPKRDKIDAKIERWSRVALSAMKQSLRCRVPEIAAPCKVDELAERVGQQVLAVFGALAGKPISSIARLQSSASLLLITGPEEGFTDREENLLTEAGALPASLGRRRLRAELAPIVLTAGCLNRVKPL